MRQEADRLDFSHEHAFWVAWLGSRFPLLLSRLPLRGSQTILRRLKIAVVAGDTDY